MSRTLTQAISHRYKIPFTDLEKIRFEIEAKDTDLTTASNRLFSYLLKVRFHEDAKAIILANPERINEYRDDSGDTCLHMVCHPSGTPEIALWLIEHGSDQTLRNDYHKLPIDIARIWNSAVERVLSPPATSSSSCKN